MLGTNHQKAGDGQIRTSRTLVSFNEDDKSQVVAVEEDDDILTTEEYRRLFIQAAAFNGLNLESTLDFVNQFLGMNLTKEQVRGLIAKYRDRILSASSALNLYVTDKFSFMSIMQRAVTINNGMMVTSKLTAHMSVMVEKLDPSNERHADAIESLVKRNTQIASTFSKWNAEYKLWEGDARELMDSAYGHKQYAQVVKDEKIIDPQKVVKLMARNGKSNSEAQTIAALLSTGDIWITEHEKEDEDRYRHEQEGVEVLEGDVFVENADTNIQIPDDYMQQREELQKAEYDRAMEEGKVENEVEKYMNKNNGETDGKDSDG